MIDTSSSLLLATVGAIGEHRGRIQGVSVTETKRRTVGILRNVLVVEDKGMFNVAFFRVNGCHADDLNAGAVVASGWNVFI